MFLWSFLLTVRWWWLYTKTFIAEHCKHLFHTPPPAPQRVTWKCLRKPTLIQNTCTVLMKCIVRQSSNRICLLKIPPPASLPFLGVLFTYNAVDPLIGHYFQTTALKFQNFLNLAQKQLFYFIKALSVSPTKNSLLEIPFWQYKSSKFGHLI